MTFRFGWCWSPFGSELVKGVLIDMLYSVMTILVFDICVVMMTVVWNDTDWSAWRSGIDILLTIDRYECLSASEVLFSIVRNIIVPSWLMLFLLSVTDDTIRLELLWRKAFEGGEGYSRWRVWCSSKYSIFDIIRDILMSIRYWPILFDIVGRRHSAIYSAVLFSPVFIQFIIPIPHWYSVNDKRNWLFWWLFIRCLMTPLTDVPFDIPNGLATASVAKSRREKICSCRIRKKAILTVS